MTPQCLQVVLAFECQES